MNTVRSMVETCFSMLFYLDDYRFEGHVNNQVEQQVEETDFDLMPFELNQSSSIEKLFF